ncbi:MAG: mycofactocin biosynthesis peptidyl-dipeptidase MftE [Acidimicrobiia bacterium]
MERLGDLVWTDLDGRRPVLVVPVGSLEQHGPHLPLDTDTRIAKAVATGAVTRLDDGVLGPTIPVGASGEHGDFDGTLSIGTEALAAMLIELVRSADVFAGTVLVNGHGGNLEALRRVQDLSTAEGRRVLVWSPSMPGADAHAGRTETSLLLAIDASCVRADAMAPGVTEPLGELVDRLRRDGVRAVSPTGVLGDPTGASAEEGLRLLAQMIDDLVERVTRWSTP